MNIKALRAGTHCVGDELSDKTYVLTKRNSCVIVDLVWKKGLTAMIKSIEQLKKEKDVVILAHYYVDDEVQKVADYVGDSYYLSKIATTVPQKTILFCGVTFMGESAKLLNPNKKVLLPDATADCPMAHMAEISKIEEIKKQYKDVAVVCYINSTAELKQYVDVCVTSSNALKIVKNLPNEYIYFIPDYNLGHYIAEQIPEKKFIFNSGYCPVHQDITADSVKRKIKQYPNAKVLVHPECQSDVILLGDYVGSTSFLIQAAKKEEAEEFIVCTEKGILYELRKNCPNKDFYLAGEKQVCQGMKLVTLEKIRQTLEQEKPEQIVELSEDTIRLAKKPLEKMLELSEK